MVLPFDGIEKAERTHIFFKNREVLSHEFNFGYIGGTSKEKLSSTQLDIGAGGQSQGLC